MPSNDSQKPAFIWLAIFAALCLACDFLMVPALAMTEGGPPTMPEVPVALAIAGCVLAQGNLLAAWLAWSDQPFWQRFRRHWMVAAVLYLAWALGMALVGLALGGPGEMTVAGVVVGLSVPLASMATQIPLWIVRQVFGWRLIHGDPQNDAGPRPLLIRHLMYATVLVAISLAVARLAPITEQERWFFWAYMSVVAVVFSSLAMLPAAAFLKMQPFRRGLIRAGLYAAFWVGLQWSIVIVLRVYGLVALPPAAMVVGVSCLILSFAATVMVAASFANALGYRLVSGRVRRKTSSD